MSKMNVVSVTILSLMILICNIEAYAEDLSKEPAHAITLAPEQRDGRNLNEGSNGKMVPMDGVKEDGERGQGTKKNGELENFIWKEIEKNVNSK